jgi:D-arginine dehydrogenase
MSVFDFLIIGAGIGGASAAFGLSRHGRVLLVEMEDRPGYHTTGRSAAFYSETYGNAAIRVLTVGSRAFFDNPPPDFASGPLLGGRGVLHVGRPDQRAAVEAKADEVQPLLETVRLITAREIEDRVPVMREGYADCGLFEPQAKDIDVGALHQGFLKLARRRGAESVNGSEVVGMKRAHGVWTVETLNGAFEAKVVVNAAGAWGDRVGALAGARPIGLQPLRRTIVIVPSDYPPGLMEWPLVIDIGEQFYFKPESGRILISPCDETPMPPSDVQPDELDIARAIDRVQRAARIPVPSLLKKWAGLRTFAPDKTPVVGFDGKVDSFFWFVGQGGYGIQTSPAMARVAEALATGSGIPNDLAELGLSQETLSPRRFR